MLYELNSTQIYFGYQAALPVILVYAGPIQLHHTMKNIQNGIAKRKMKGTWSMSDAFFTKILNCDDILYLSV